MKLLNERYGRNFIASLVLHLLAFSFLLFSMDAGFNGSQMPEVNGDIVQATVVDDQKTTEAEAAEIPKVEENQQQIDEEAQQKKISANLEQVKREREQEQAKLDQIKKEVAKAEQEEQDRLAEIKVIKEKEKKQLEDLKLAKEKEKKRLAALDDERQAEQERTQAMRVEREKEESKRAAANKQKLETKRKADEAKRQAALKAEKAAKEAQLAAANNARLNDEAVKILAIWEQKIKQNARPNLALDPNLACDLRMDFLPDGSVRVTKIKSSGNLVFDDDAIKAIYKTQPFTLPTDPALRERVKSVSMTFKND